MHILSQTEPTLSYQATLIAITFIIIRINIKLMRTSDNRIAITVSLIANTNYTIEQSINHASHHEYDNSTNRALVKTPSLPHFHKATCSLDLDCVGHDKQDNLVKDCDG